MRRILRIFISSPGDVDDAREVAAQIVEKIAQDYASHFIIKPYLWEYEPMIASGHFQDSIEPPSNFDVVTLVLFSRLGTPLPERTAVREYRGIDGRVPVTGTEWEFEDALRGWRESGTPDLLVYRSRQKAQFDPSDAASRQAVITQADALDSFWARHFADKGAFIGAFSEFRSLEEFAQKFERDMRASIERRLDKLDPEERKGERLWHEAPFRGLESYAFKHAAIFFGRHEAIGATLLRLSAKARTGEAFLLLLGSSGSGKSSLVKAGVVPRLFVPQRVPNTAFLRYAIFRPSDARTGEDLFLALARRLVEHDGDREGLPELLGPSTPVEKLANHLREGFAHPALPFETALDRLAEGAMKSGAMLRSETAKLILVVDQLEELFTSGRIAPEECQRFIQLLSGLAKSDRVWVIATMRSDFWYRASEAPELVRLADGLGRIDILPPTPAEISQMIQRPAEAAGLRFEISPKTDIPLNDHLAEEASREPGALPLLSYFLDQLYKQDVEQGGGHTLTYESSERLGGLKGAIAISAEAVLQAQPPEVQAALDDVLFSLVQVSPNENGFDRAVARRAPLSEFPAGSTKRALVDALLSPAARLLVAQAEIDGAATVMLAHEALITEWTAVRNYVAKNAEILGARRRLEERIKRWQSLSQDTAGTGAQASGWLGHTLDDVRNRFRRKPGLLADIDLVEAQNLIRDHRETLNAQQQDFITLSIADDKRVRQQSIRWLSLGAALMSVLFVIAVIAGIGIYGAERKANAAKEEAEVSLWIANSEAELRNGHPELAIQLAAKAFASRPGAESRSALYRSLSQLSPYLVAIEPLRGSPAPPLTWTSNGTIAFLAADGNLRLRDLSHPSRIQAAHSHQGPGADHMPVMMRTIGSTNTVAVYDDGSVWTIDGGGARHALRGAIADVNPVAGKVAISRDGATIVEVLSDGPPRLLACQSAPCRDVPWTVPVPRVVDINPADNRIALAVQPDPNTPISELHIVSANGTIIDTQKVDGEVVSLAWSSQRNWLAAGMANGAVAILNLDGNTWFNPVAPDRATVSTLAWQPKADVLAYVCGQTNICIASFDANGAVDASRPRLTFSGHQAAVVRLAWAPDGGHLVSADAGQDIRIWSTTPDDRIAFDLDSIGDATAIAVAGSARRLAVVHENGAVRVWSVDAAHGRPSLTLSATLTPPPEMLAEGSTATTVAWGPVDALAIGFTGSNTLLTWHGMRGMPIPWPAAESPAVQGLWADAGAPSRLAWSDSETRMTLPLNDGRIALVDPSSKQAELYLPRIRSGVAAFAVAVSPHSPTAVASYDAGALVLWDLRTRKELARLPVVDTSAAPLGLAISQDGRLLASTGGDATIKLYDLEAHTLKARLPLASSDSGGAVAFNKDGTLLAATGSDKKIYLWQLADASAQSFMTMAASCWQDSETERAGGFAVGLAWIGPATLSARTPSGHVCIFNVNPDDWKSRAAALGL